MAAFISGCTPGALENNLTPNVFLWDGADDLMDLELITQIRRGMARRIDKSMPTVIFIDTLARYFMGDENSTEEMNRFVTLIQKMFQREFGATVVLVHHTGHAERNRMRGSSVLKAALDTELRLEFRGDEDDTTEFDVKCTKQKDGRQPAPMAFRRRTLDLGIEGEYEGDTQTSAVLDVIADGYERKSTDNVSDIDFRPQSVKDADMIGRIVEKLLVEHKANGAVVPRVRREDVNSRFFREANLSGKTSGQRTRFRVALEEYLARTDARSLRGPFFVGDDGGKKVG